MVGRGREKKLGGEGLKEEREGVGYHEGGRGEKIQMKDRIDFSPLDRHQKQLE